MQHQSDERKETGTEGWGIIHATKQLVRFISDEYLFAMMIACTLDANEGYVEYLGMRRMPIAECKVMCR